MKTKNQMGFTLIELVVVIAIIAIISAFAVPSYRDYVLKSKRTEAMNALTQIAALQERYYVNNNKYGSKEDLGLGALFPTPTTANGKNYTIDMNATDTTYSITADAHGGQQKDTKCLKFTLDNLGVKTGTTSDCWR